MDQAIKHYFGKEIKEQVRLTGGFTFQTWLLVLSGGQKVVFRSQRDFDTGGGRKIIIADVLERERFFYESVNKKIGRICPEVYVVDGTRELYDQSYVIMEYIEGIPLNTCFSDFDTHTKNSIFYKIGEVSAWINNIEIDPGHPYVTSRNSWEEYMADRVYERLIPHVSNNLITHDEINRIADGLRGKKAVKTLSFLHLDMRRINMIYRDGNIFILDAENCEFGDPLSELATIDVAQEFDPVLLEGYKNAYGGDIDLEDELYLYYKMERAALVLDVFMNAVKTDVKTTKYYLALFNELKGKLL